MIGRLLCKYACVLLFLCFIHSATGSAAEALLVSLTEEEQQTIRDAQARMVREAEGNLLRSLQANVERPYYPLDDLVNLVGGEPAVLELARLLTDPKFQSKPAHFQILHALERLRVGGAGRQIAAIIRQGIYKDDAAMLSFAVNAFSPAEVKEFARDLIPYLNHENTLLRTLVAHRLVAAGVKDAEAQFVKLIADPDRYVEMAVMNALFYCNDKVGLLALDTLNKAKSDGSRHLIAHIVVASGINDQRQAVQSILDEMQFQPQPRPIKDGRDAQAAVAAIQSLLLHEKYGNWIARNEEPLLFPIEDVGADFRLPGRRIKLVRSPHIQILGLQDKALSIRALNCGQDSILISVGIAPVTEGSRIQVTLKNENGEYRVVSIEYRPGK